MFLHLGSDIMVSKQKIIVIMEMRLAETSQTTRDFLALAGAEERLTSIAGGEAKSFVLTDEGVYLSPISAPTLQKRAMTADIPM